MIQVDAWSFKCAKCDWTVASERTVNFQTAVADALIRNHIRKHEAEKCAYCGHAGWGIDPHQDCNRPDGPAPVHASGPREETTAWLVALGSSTPQWWTGRGDEWTTDVDGTKLNPSKCAMRFARREDAERAIGWLVKEGTRDGCKAEEHIWL